ncbi:MAG: hypothetical protein O2901_14100 [Verrucomicrobia bacterium]|nr:hypothetical protein [Verrucomicrobiota bacterium]
MQTIFVPDLAALRRKLDDPPPLLAKCYARFRQRLALDGEFRRHHVFLPALLGDPTAVVEAKGQIVMLALNPRILARERPEEKSPGDTIENHIWCVTPRAMRLAAYFSWLDIQGAWTPDERRTIGTGLMDFFDTYVVPVLRARVPGGHNQQLSLTLCSSVVGHAFAEVDGVAARACALRDWSLPKFKQVLGLMSSSGYSGEGSTYQSGVVSGLVMWAGVFLEQLGECDVWNRRWAPNGGRLSDTLRIEAVLSSCGGLLPPWDHYGWSRLHNLAARTLWAGLGGDASLLQAADAAWDEPHNLAWRPDDRLWTLLYWPEEEGQEAGGRGVSPALGGWSEPAVGAAVEHRLRRLRVMSVWDRCSGSLQGLGRAQVNPNHLIIDLGGEPITADGWEIEGEQLFSDDAMERTRRELTPVEKELIERQYGSVDAWVRASQCGFLGASCAIVIDGWESYFPRSSREGRLVFESRDAERHTFAGEAAAYYQPAFDVTRMRRTVSMNAAGVTWVVDDLRALSRHEFTWRLWLRRGAHAAGAMGVRLDLPAGPATTFALFAEADGEEVRGSKVELTTAPTFPVGRSDVAWQEPGSQRCDLTTSGRAVRIVTCLVPEGAEGLALRQTADGAWAADWEGGSDRFELPSEIGALPDAEPVCGEQCMEAETLCDLDEAPYLLLDDPDAALLAALEDPPVGAWRRTGAAMQTLAVRDNRDALPGMIALLLDARQNYCVHSVAAWCLGHMRCVAALDVLRRMMNIPEVNTAARARWAVESIEACIHASAGCEDDRRRNQLKAGNDGQGKVCDEKKD